jgi:hypothetical protein
LLHPCLHIVLAMYSEFISIHMIACHHVVQLHTCPYTVVNLLACCPSTHQNIMYVVCFLASTSRCIIVTYLSYKHMHMHVQYQA